MAFAGHGNSIKLWKKERPEEQRRATELEIAPTEDHLSFWRRGPVRSTAKGLYEGRQSRERGDMPSFEVSADAKGKPGPR